MKTWLFKKRNCLMIETARWILFFSVAVPVQPNQIKDSTSIFYRKREPPLLLDKIWLLSGTSKLMEFFAVNCADKSIQCWNLFTWGGVHKLRLQDEVGRWLSKCQQMSTGVGRWSVICQCWLFSIFQGCVGLIIYVSDQTTRSHTKKE